MSTEVASLFELWDDPDFLTKVGPEVGPNADALTGLTRGRGPRRGNLEALFRYWRPIMKKPGGFRRCVVILADNPKFGGQPQRICAWLHHEITGKWPNEGKGKGKGSGKRRGGKRRSVRRSVTGRRAKSAIISPESFDISPLRLALRESRDFNGVLVQPIAGRQNAVDMKAALFSTYTERVLTHSDISEKRVGIFGGSSRTTQAVQAVGTAIAPGDLSDVRSPIRSQIFETLSPGGGGGRSRGGVPNLTGLVRGRRRGRSEGGTRNKFRCPPGFQKGGTFTNAQFSTCGAQILGIPSKGVGAPSEGAQRALASLARDASIVREIGDLRSNRSPYDIIRAAQIPVAPKKGSPTRRQLSINNVLAQAEEEDFSVRAVRRDGVILEPVVSLEALAKLDEFDDLADGTLIDSYNRGQLGSDLVPTFSTGLRDVYEDIPGSGSVRVSRVGGELSSQEVDSLRRVFPTSLRRSADLPDPSAAIRDFAERSDGRFKVEYGELKNNRFTLNESKNELISVAAPGGATMVVPRWVYDTFLSRSAPRRAKNDTVYEIANDKKSVNPFFVAHKNVVLSDVPVSFKQAEVSSRALAFSKMLEGGDVDVKKGGRSRAIFDGNINRFRCPPGSRYGGRISDEFGRNCGYTLPRRVVNGLVDLGVRVEDAMERRAKRRGKDRDNRANKGVSPDARVRLDEINLRLDALEKEMDAAFAKVEDGKPGRIGATIDDRKKRSELTPRERELLQGEELAVVIEDLNDVITSPGYDGATAKEIKKTSQSVEKVANLEAGRLTETPPRTPEQKSMAARILEGIENAVRSLLGHLGVGGRKRNRTRDRDDADTPTPREREGGGRPRVPSRGDRDRDRDRGGDRGRDRDRDRDRDDNGARDDNGDRARDADNRPTYIDNPDQKISDDDNDLLNEMQERQEAFDLVAGGKTGTWVDQLDDDVLESYIDVLERVDLGDVGVEARDLLRAERDRRGSGRDRNRGGNRGGRDRNNNRGGREDRGRNGDRDVNGGAQDQRDRRDEDMGSDDLNEVLNELQYQEEQFDLVSGGNTATWVQQVSDGDLDRFIDALDQAQDMGPAVREMQDKLVAERRRRKRVPKSEDDVLQELDDRARVFDLRFGGETLNFISSLEDAELNRFIEGLRRNSVGDAGAEMLERLERERAFRKGPAAPHRRRVEEVNIGRRVVDNRNRRVNIAELDDLGDGPEKRSNLRYQAAVEFDELGEEWRKVLEVEGLNDFSLNDMRNFVALQSRAGNTDEYRKWRRKHNDFLELNELNNRLDKASNDDEKDEALRDHVGRLAAHHRRSIINAINTNNADRPKREAGPEERGGEVPVDKDINLAIREINDVVAAENMGSYSEAELNDRIDRLNSEFSRYSPGGDMDGPPPRRLTQALNALKTERSRRDNQIANAVDAGPGRGRFPEPPARGRFPEPPARERLPEPPARGRFPSDLQGRIDRVNEMSDDELDALDSLVLDNVALHLNNEQGNAAIFGNNLPDDLDRAYRRTSAAKNRRRLAEKHQIDQPLQDRDDDALNSHIAAMEEQLRGEPGSRVVAQLEELKAERARRDGLINNVESAVTSNSGNGNNNAPVRSLSSKDWRGAKKRKERKRQEQINKIARERFGSERPFEIKDDEGEGGEAYMRLSPAKRKAYIKKMFSDGVEIDGGTQTLNGVTYRKTMTPTVTSISSDGDPHSALVESSFTYRMYRQLPGGGEELIAKQDAGYDWPFAGSRRQLSDIGKPGVAPSVEHKYAGLQTHFDPAKNEFVRTSGVNDASKFDDTMHIDMRGGGIISEYNSNAMLFYKGLGIDKVEVQAASDGHASWPLQGFRDYNSNNVKQLNFQMLEFVDEYDQFISKMEAGEVPTRKQMQVGMIIQEAEAAGDPNAINRVRALVDHARNEANADNLPAHFEYLDALLPREANGKTGRNDLAFAMFAGRQVGEVNDINLDSDTKKAARQRLVAFAEKNNVSLTDSELKERLNASAIAEPRMAVVTYGTGALDISGLNTPPPPPPTPEGRIRQPVDGYKGVLGSDSDGRAAISEAVPVGANGMNTKEDAVAYLKNGGNLSDVPDMYLNEAITNNLHDSDGNNPQGRFKELPTIRGPINGMKLVQDKNTGAFIGIKFAEGWGVGHNEAYNEMLGNGLAERLGFPVGQMRFDGPLGGTPDRRRATPTLVVELAHNTYGLDLANVDANMMRAGNAGGDLPTDSKVRMTMLDMILGNPDRHGNNFFAIRRSDEKAFDAYPIDFGYGFDHGMYGQDGDYKDYSTVDRMKKWRENDYAGAGRNRMFESLKQRYRSGDAGREEVRSEISKALDTIKANQQQYGSLSADVDAATGIAGHSPLQGDNNVFDATAGRIVENHDWYVNADVDDIIDLWFP